MTDTATVGTIGPVVTALRLGNDQVRAFETLARGRFADEMVAHLRTFSPGRCGALSPADLQAAVAAGIRRADTYGFTRRGPIRLFLEAMVLLGGEFDEDPLHPSITAQLHGHGDEMARANNIHAELLTYRADVTGPDGGRLRDGLAALLELTRVAQLRPDQPQAVDALATAYPAKAAHAGRDGLQELARRATLEANDHRLASPHVRSVFLVTMFALGHGVTRDWSHPAIQRSLAGEADADTRAARFEAAALAELMQAHANVAGRATT